jgi:hypothetical protein
MMAASRDASNPLAGLKEVQADGAKLPPVHLWNPPFCGDIDMRIAADGTWFYMNSPIGRKPLYTLFSRVLRKDGDSYFLVTPVEKCGIRVDDAPFTPSACRLMARADHKELHSKPTAMTLVTVDAEHPLRFATEVGTGGLKPYVLVRANLEALVIRALFYDLVARGTVEDGWFGVWSGGMFFPMQRADEIGIAP